MEAIHKDVNLRVRILESLVMTGLGMVVSTVLAPFVFGLAWIIAVAQYELNIIWAILGTIIFMLLFSLFQAGLAVQREIQRRKENPAWRAWH